MRRAAAVSLAGAVLTLAAFGFDAAPLFVAGLGFLAIGLVTPAAVAIAARQVNVSRRIDLEHVIEGQPVPATIMVSCGPLGIPGGFVHDPVLSEPLAIRKRRAELHTDARFQRRGRQLLDPPQLTASDALGLASVTRRGSGAAQELLVLPRTEPVRWLADARGRRRRGAEGGAGEEPLAAVDVDGLRP
ncbi:MAG: hypothetical protein ACYDHH_26640, partial [Solirubrobacteraceae bacterium]